MLHLLDAAPAALIDLLRRQPFSEAKLQFAWRVTVGSAMERATTIRLRRDRTLDVLASDANWSREVDRAAPVIVERLGLLLGSGVVSRISCRSGDWRRDQAAGDAAAHGS